MYVNYTNVTYLQRFYIWMEVGQNGSLVNNVVYSKIHRERYVTLKLVDAGLHSTFTRLHTGWYT